MKFKCKNCFYIVISFLFIILLLINLTMYKGIRNVKHMVSNNVSSDIQIVDDVFRYFAYSKEDIFEEFGINTLHTYYDCFEALTYNDIGLSFVFDCGNYDEIVLINLHHNIDVNGVSARMNLNDIKSYLETTYNIELEINRNIVTGNYYIEYDIGHYVVFFSSSKEDYSYCFVELIKKRN